MNNKKYAGIILIAIGTLLLFTTSDKEFINLTPTQGVQHTLALETGKTYTQSFTVHKKTISRIGFQFKTLKRNIPNDNITIKIYRDDTLLHKQTLPVVFLPNDKASYIRIDPVIQTNPKETLQATITIPPSLSNTIGLQLRKTDDSFNTNEVKLTIDNEIQDNPAAYEVYQQHRPPLALQFGGLLILAGIYLLLPIKNIAVYAIFTSLIYSIPAFLDNHIPILLITTQAIIYIAMFTFLRKTKIRTIPSIFGANILAYTTWFPLHYLSPQLTLQSMNLKDIFIDPNQVLQSHAAGSYIGIIALFFAITGLLWFGWKKKTIIAIGIIGLILSLLTPHTIILTTFALAYYAAYGINKLQTYLGKNRLTTFIIITIVILSLLDQFHAAAASFKNFIT